MSSDERVMERDSRDACLAPAPEAPCTAAVDVMEEKKWPNNEHLHHAHYLPGNSFTATSSLQSAVIFYSKNYEHVKASASTFVQILNVQDYCWPAVSSVKCNSNTTNICDSLNSTRLKAADKFSCQLLPC